jgi:methylmalonyl-CoA mutase N-terminal domain/subunit
MVENSEEDLTDSRRQVEDWLLENADALVPSDMASETLSGLPINPIYTELDAVGRYSETGPDLPGRFPYTRGVNPAMYREQLWVMGQYSGHGSAKETNKRIRSLLENGQKGFSVALDLPTQMGLDSDDPRSRGEVGRVGVPVDSVHDMVDLLQGIELDKVRQIRTTANAIGPIAVAHFVVAAERLGYKGTEFKVMLQNDVLKEYVARGTYIFPPEKGLRFSADVIEYCAKNLPNWEPIEFCGYHIRDSGSNAVQEVAIAMANGLAYIDESIRRGLTIDDFGHSLFMFLSAHLDIFEEVAKFRAARTLWALTMKERYGASDHAAKIGIFTYTLGSPQTAQEPLNNIVRIAYQSLAAILGGVQTLATSAYDEAIQLPSDEAARVSLRTQQILAYETGVPRTPDPLAGSYLVESLTRDLMTQIQGKIEQIEVVGGALKALETGWISNEIDSEAYRQQAAIDSGERVVIGVNRYASEQVELRHQVKTDPRLAEEQIEALQKLRATRDKDAVDRTLDDLRTAAAGDENTLPFIIEAIRAEATVGEVCSALRDTWGVFTS